MRINDNSFATEEFPANNCIERLIPSMVEYRATSTDRIAKHKSLKRIQSWDRLTQREPVGSEESGAPLTLALLAIP